MACALKQDAFGAISPAEYLRRERAAVGKSEYADGRIVVMAGASPEHNRISTNLSTAFDNRLSDESGCAPFNSGQRVRLTDAGPFYYPDLSVACNPTFDHEDCLLNPSVIVEVLSEPTEQNDRVEKWLRYQQMESLRAYVLVAQTQILVEIFERADSGADWIYRSYRQRSDSLRLQGLSITIPVSEVYRRISCDPPNADV